jgi:hypothetical protein
MRAWLVGVDAPTRADRWSLASTGLRAGVRHMASILRTRRRFEGQSRNASQVVDDDDPGALCGCRTHGGASAMQTAP